MPDPPVELADPPPPLTVLVDRRVRFVDELKEIIEETGGLPLDVSIEAVLKDLPACRSIQDWEDQQQRAIQEEIVRYRAEVEEPAFAILRERKASRPGAMRKEPVTFSGCPDYYRQVLDGIDPRLPQLTGGAVVNSLAIGISWPPSHPLWNNCSAVCIASCHDYLLALYFNTNRNRFSSPGFYLVINTWANSVAIIPPLPTGCFMTTSLCGIGTEVAVLRHNIYGDYVLAELYLHQDSRSHLSSNKANLFLWWSPGSGPLAGRWMQKEVVLPLPADEDTAPPTYSFHADMVFAVSTTSLCWVDLRTGILVCDRIGMLAAGTEDDDGVVFHFIPLPEECATKPDLLSRFRPAEEYRTMFCIDHETILFVCMDSYTQGYPIDKSMLTTWTLSLPLTKHWKWFQDSKSSLCLGDLLDNLLILKNNRRLLIPSHPVISKEGRRVVTHLIVTGFDYQLGEGRWKATGLYKLSIDMYGDMYGVTVLEGSSPGSEVVRFAQLFAADISWYLEQTMEWESLQQQRRSTLKSPSGEEVVDEDEYWEWVLPEELADEDEPRVLILCQNGIRMSTPYKEMVSSKIRVGLQCVLD